MPTSIRSTLQTARPGFWATQLWFYLLPLGGRELLDRPQFWLGAVYATFPLGHLLYGWNDLADRATDRLNPRKGNLLFGGRLSPEELRRLPSQIAAVQLPFVGLFTWMIGAKALWWFAATLAVNALYNSPAFNFKARPLLDLANQTGYLLLFVLSSWLNDVPQLSAPAFVFGALFAMHSHLLGQMSDIEPDRAVGRRTTAVAIGVANSKLLAAALLFAESWIVFHYFESRFLAAFLMIAAVSFLLDYFARGHRTVSDRQLTWIFLAWNAVALASMVWIWRAAIFVE